MKAIVNALYFYSYELFESLSSLSYEQGLVCHAKNRRVDCRNDKRIITHTCLV